MNAAEGYYDIEILSDNIWLLINAFGWQYFVSNDPPYSECAEETHHPF